VAHCQLTLDRACSILTRIETLKFGFILDIIGVVKSTDDVRTMMSKASKELKKRDVTLVDESQVQVRLTLWGSDVCLLCNTFIHFSFCARTTLILIDAS
jgi:ssDNA-binding replication factor A large subunit